MRDWGPDRSQCTSVEVPEEPRLPRARGARQQPRRDAVQERAQECVTGGPDRSQCTSVEVPEEPWLPRARGARQQPRKDAVQSGLKIASLGS